MAPAKRKSSRSRAKKTGVKPLPTKALRWQCKSKQIPYASTRDAPAAKGVVGQDAAVDALRYGLQTTAPGQNVFVRGLTGTGRLTLVRRTLEDIQPLKTDKKDRCYVHNFAQPDRPSLVTLPAGQGHLFRRRVSELIDFIREDLGEVLTSEGTKSRRTALEQRAEAEFQKIVKPFEETLEKEGLALVTVRVGSVNQNAIFPLVNDQPTPPEQFEQLYAQGEIQEAQYQQVIERIKAYNQQLEDIQEKTRDVRRQHVETIQNLVRQTARSALLQLVRGIQQEFDTPEVRTFLRGLLDDVIHNRLRALAEGVEFTDLYRVNVVVDNECEGLCPIIVENTPTMRHLLGSIDFEISADGEVRASHMGIRAGSLLRADGGYIVLEAHDVLSEAGAWKVLIRSLRTGRLEIVPHELTMMRPGPSLQPEPIDIQVKVVLLGDTGLYYTLDHNDPDFSDLFKVLADFESEIPRDDSGIRHYSAVLARIAQDEDLAPFDRSAIAALAEHGARIAARAGKLSARFGRIADIAREASFLARERNGKKVTGDLVRESIVRGKQRAGLPSRRFHGLVRAGTIRLQTQGSVVGQINGLAVLTAGPLAYGFPTRITATIGPGTAGVINIEREAALSGAIHTKGFYILGGLLRSLLRTNHPLAFDASIAFEQSYGGIDGDSASGAEMCCLLSALTDIPVRQDLAMTGAIDQMGNILAIGAVNEKIEGFFDACRDLDYTHTQGVIIPRANAGDLMLRTDVVQACAAKQFAVYAVDTILEALELFTGIPAGQRDENGDYPEDSVLGVAMQRADEYWLKAVGARLLMSPDEDEEEEDETTA
jgi:predicted ATP-dependent protease